MYRIDDMVGKIVNGNSLEKMKNIPDGSIDHIQTDPPFGIEFDGKSTMYNRNKDNVVEGYEEVKIEDYLEFSKKWIGEAYRVLKKDGSILVVSGWTNLMDVMIALDEAGFETINHLIWKYQFGVFTKKKFVTSHYHLLFAVKNPKKYTFNKIDHYPEDVFEIQRKYERGQKKTATKLPIALVEKFLKYLTNKGDVVLDPFFGSGTLGIGCIYLDRKWIGIEICGPYIEIAKERLKDARNLRRRQLI